MAQRYDHRWHILGLVSPTPGAIVHGWAATVRFLPRRADLRDPDRHDFAPVVRSAGAGEGHVLMIGCGSYRDAAVAGGKKLTLVEVLGFRRPGHRWTSARLRRGGRNSRSSPAAAARPPLADNSDLMAFESGVPVEIGGTLVTPGDWIYSDDAGTVVVPATDVHEVLAAALEREKADAEEVARIRNNS